MVSAKGVLGAFVVIVVGVALLPTINTLATMTAGINGTAFTMTALMPLFFALCILGGAVASVSMF